MSFVKGQRLAAMTPAVFVLIWSTGFIVARYAMPHSPPLKFLVLRYALSVLCFVLWMALARVRWPQDPSQWKHLAISGILVHAGYLGGVWTAVKWGMGSGLIALIAGLQPVLTAAWMSATSGGSVSRRQWVGLGLGFSGLALVVARKFEGTSEANLGTLTMALFALLCITAGTLYQKKNVTVADVRSANAVQMGAALIVSLPFAWAETESMQWSMQLAGALAWAVLALSLGGSSLMYLLLQRGAATAVTSLLYLVPPCTAVMALLLFGEPVDATTIAGMVITAAGVSLVVRQARPVQDPP